ncbi:MAG: hypothetical protein EA362_04830 [Saprospirales bacterium]|nr:MAG: hypothetical protein EA362_04830 [Saprospirales bacterium]
MIRKKIKSLLHFAAALFFLIFMGGQISAQEFDFDEFFEEAPNLETEFLEARMFMITGQYDEAAERLNNLLSQDSDNAVFLYELARTYDALGQQDRALDAAQSAHRNAPDNEWMLQLLANLSANMDRSDLAEDAYRKLLEIHPHRSNYAISRAYHLLLLSDREQALEVLHTIERRVGVTPELAAKKISIYRGDGDKGNIENEYRKLIKAFPKNSSFRMEMVDFFLVSDQEEKAKTVLEEVLEIDPENSRAQVLLARMAGSMEDDPLAGIHSIISNPSIDADEKIRELIPFVIQLSESYNPELSAGLARAAETLTGLHPERVEAMALAGDVAFSSYQFVAAKNYYASALEIRTNVVQVWFNYLETLLRLRDFEMLFKETERALEYYPNQALFYYYLSRAYAGKGELDMARTTFSRANLMSRRQPGLGVYMVLAESELELKSENVQEALDLVDTGLREFGPEPDLIIAKARILTEFKENPVELEAVLDQIEKSVAADPDYLILRALHTKGSGDQEKAGEIMDVVMQYDFSMSRHVLEAAVKIFNEVRPDQAEEIRQILNGQTQ